MWINAQAVYKACYCLVFTKRKEASLLYDFWVGKIRDENTKFRWRRLSRSNLTRTEAAKLMHCTSHGDEWRVEVDRLMGEINRLNENISHAFEAKEILEDGTCFVGQDVLNMIQPYLNGQERIEDDSRSD